MRLKRTLTSLIHFIHDADRKRHELRKLYIEKFRYVGRSFYTISGIVSFFILIIEYGFFYPREWVATVKLTVTILVYFFIFYEIISLIFTSLHWIEYFKLHKIEFVILLMIGLEFIYEKELIYLLKEYHLTGDDGTLLFLSINQILFFFSNLAHFFRLSKNSESKKLNPSLIFILSFVAIIAIGVLFLHFPKSTNGNISSIDILFTTVSATCVTGLSTINISEAFTTTGKLIILLLIQIGGLGLMTLTSFFSIFLAGKVSVSDNLLVKDLLSEETIGRAKEILKQVTLLTLMIETIGAVLLYHSFPEHMKFTQSERIYFSIFHSISAFCNAGFSLFPDGLSVGFQNNKYFLSSIMVLIVFGGLGFPVLSQIKTKFLKPNNKHFRFSVSTKLALTVSLYLWILGFISYYFLESKFTLSGMSIFDRVFQSMFYSITTRTAGFNTLDIAQMGIPMTFMSFFLMWVGASPVSTGGGIKTTTFALSFLNILNQIRGKQRMEINHRTIASSSISRASATIVLSLFVIFSAVFILLITESGTFLDLCFEVVSAFGTVGLTRGITPNLSLYGKITICVVMFVGRVGILTLLIALSKKSKQINYSYPEEYVVVG